MMTILESDLIDRLKSNNERAYAHLYNTHSVALFRLINRKVRHHLAAEEILQNVFLKTWLNIGSYSAEKGCLFSWMLSIARNEAIDYLRSKHVRILKLTFSIQEPEQKEVTFTEKRLLRFDLLKSLAQLPYKERVIIELHKTGFSCREVGQMLCLPEGSVKTKMRSIYKKLRVIHS